MPGGGSKMSEKEPKTKEPVLDEKRKNALLRYMAVLFGVAFFLVMLTYLIQLRDTNQTISQLNTTSASAIQNAEKLQEDNRALNDTVKSDREKMSTLETEVATQEMTITKLEEDLEEQKATTKEAYEEVSQMEALAKDTLRTYEILLVAEQDQKKGAYELVRLALVSLNEAYGTLGVEGKARVDALEAAYHLATAVTP